MTDQEVLSEVRQWLGVGPSYFWGRSDNMVETYPRKWPPTAK